MTPIVSYASSLIRTRALRNMKCVHVKHCDFSIEHVGILIIPKLFLFILAGAYSHTISSRNTTQLLFELIRGKGDYCKNISFDMRAYSRGVNREEEAQLGTTSNPPLFLSQVPFLCFTPFYVSANPLNFPPGVGCRINKLSVVS